MEETNKSNNMKNIKVSISEEKKDKYKNTLFLELENECKESKKYKTKVYLIDVSKYIEENKKMENDFEEEKILFIGLAS